MSWTKNSSLACWLQAMLIVLLACASVFSQEVASLEAQRTEAKKAYTAGQYKQAFELYKEIALSDNNTGEYAALDFGMACDSLCKLKNGDEHDRSESIKILKTIYPALGRKYEKDWKFLTNLIHSLKNSANNSFELFYFLYHSNHLVEKLENLLPTLPEMGENLLRARCYSLLASYDDPQDIHYGREFFFCELKDNAQSTDLDDETSEETLQGEDAWQRSAYCNKCLTHDGQLKPVTMPEAYKQSRLRGEKWLWYRARLLECVPEEEKADILLSTADTLYRLFGEWSAIRSHIFFPLDGKPIPQTYLNQLRSLKENETLLRFDRTTFLIRPLPEAVDFYRIYKSLAEKGNAKAMLRLGQIHENRRQLDTALEWYQKALTLLPDKSLCEKLQNEVIPRLSGPSLSFSPFTMISPNTSSSQAFIGRNLKTVQFKLQRIDNDKLLAHFLKLGSNASISKGFIDYSPVSNIGSYGFSAFWMEMPVHNLPDDCLVPNPRIWKCDYPLPDDHADITSAVELPPLEPGFYRLTATLENGVTIIKDLLCNNTHIIQTDNHTNEWGHYLVLDAVTCMPLDGITATFFYQVSKSSPLRSIDVSSDKHGRITITRQMLDFSDTPSSQKNADNEETTPFVKWYLLHIHGQNRFTFTPPTPFWPKDDTHRKYPNARQITVYTVTDRYLYHPGETVHFNIWLADGILNLPLANRSVTAIVHRDGNDEKDKSNILLPLTTDDYGSANGSFTLPENAKLGYYAISITMDDYQTAVRYPNWDYAIRHNFDTVFTVSNYVKPETSLEIQLPPTTPKPGDEFDIHFQADYLFGKAVTNATLNCTVLIGELAGDGPQFSFKDNWFCKDFHNFYDALGKIDSDNEDEKIRYLNPDVNRNRMNDIDDLVVDDDDDDDDDDDGVSSVWHNEYIYRTSPTLHWPQASNAYIPKWYPGWGTLHARSFTPFSTRMPLQRKEHQLALDSNGHAILHIDTSSLVKKYGARNLAIRISATLTDILGEETEATAEMHLAPIGVNLLASTDGTFATVALPYPIDIQTTSLDLKPLAQKCRLRLVKISFTDNAIQEHPLPWVDFTTDANGNARVFVTPPEPGHYRVHVATNDGNTMLAETSCILLAWQPDSTLSDARFNDLELWCDKAEYVVGDTARLLVCNDQKDHPVFLKRILRNSKGDVDLPPIMLSGKCALLELPITPEMASGVCFFAYTLKGNCCRSATLSLKVRRHTPLQVELHPSAPSVLPGSELTVEIKVATTDGTPAKASLVFAMYDSSLDAVMKRKSNLADAFVLPPLRYEVNDIWEAEALRTALWLSTACGDYVPIGPLLHSRLLWFDAHEPPMTTDNKVWERLCNLDVQTRYMAEEYDFYDEEDSRYSTHRTRRRWSPLLFLSKEEKIQWRKEFLDTAFWRTGIVTDENGCAKVTLKLPDNLTTWRARAWASTQDFHYGEGTCHVTATKDTLIRPMLPDFLIEGDTIALGEAVHNFTAKTVTTTAQAEFDDYIRLLEPAKIPLELPARSAQTAQWNVKAEKPGTAQVKLSATGDGVETSLPILPLEAENALSFNTILFPQSPEHLFTFEIPPTALSETPRIIVDNGYDLHGRIGQARDYLINYEYDCTEQLSNRIIGILTTQKANYQLQPSDKKLLLTAISILEKRQKDDGSWAWFSQGKGELRFTCFALRALLAANENGLNPNQLALQKGLFFLQKHASLISGEEIDKPAWENPYSSHRNSPLGDDDDDDDDDDDEEERPAAMPTPQTCTAIDVDVAELLQSQNVLPSKYLDMIFDIHPTLPVSALCKLARILKQRDDSRWKSVHQLFQQYIHRNPDTWTAHIHAGPTANSFWYANLLETNAEYLLTLQETLPDPQLIPLLMNYIMMNYSHDYAFGGTFSTATVLRALCRLPESSRQNVEATILWELDGRPLNPAKPSVLSPGAHQLKVRQTGTIPACVSARVAWREKDANAQAHPSSQIAISRSYELYSDSKRDGFHIGDIVMVELELNLLNAQEYLRVSDPLLAGIDTNVTPNSTMWDSEKHKTTMEFFLRRVPAGVFKLRYPVRLLYAGRFTALPALAEPMYAPQFKATTHADTITILP